MPKHNMVTVGKPVGSRVTQVDKRRAQKRLNIIDRLSTPGERSSVRMLAKMNRDVSRAYRTGGDPGQAALEGTLAMAPTLSQGMLLQHLRATVPKEALILASDVPIDFEQTAYTVALRKIIQLLGLAPDDLRALAEQYNAAGLQTMLEQGTRASQEVSQLAATAQAEGLPTTTAVKQIQSQLTNLGMTPVSPHFIETTYRTQTAVAYSAGQWESTQDPDIDEILWGYKYVTVGDNRVREEHQGYEGVTLPKDDPLWSSIWPPNGFNCRCSVIPIFTKRKVVRPAQGATPDEGWAFNAGQVLGK